MKKDLYFEKIRGLAIIMVILIHTIPTNSEPLLCLRQVFNFAVAMFIFLSGYFINKNQALNDSKGFINKRLFRILIPYLFWSLLIIIPLQLINGLDIKALIIKLLTGQALGPYYFIIVLLQLIIITPIMVRLDRYRLGVFALYAITPISLFALYYINLINNTPFTFYSLPFTMWFLFYYYGYRIRQNEKIKKIISKSIIRNLIIYFIFLALSMLEATLINESSGQISFAVSQIKISSFLASIALINLALSLKNHVNNKPGILSNIGNMSFGIFFIHMIVIIFVQQLTKIIHINITVPLLWALVGLFGSMTVIVIARKIFGATISRKYFGF